MKENSAAVVASANYASFITESYGAKDVHSINYPMTCKYIKGYPWLQFHTRCVYLDKMQLWDILRKLQLRNILWKEELQAITRLIFDEQWSVKMATRINSSERDIY